MLLRVTHKRLLIVGLISCLAAVVVVSILLPSPHAVAPSTKANTVTKQKTVQTNDISLVATGDWIAHDTINAQAKQADGSYSYLPMIADLKPYFASSDIRFCNDPILNGGSVSAVAGYPKFNSPADFVKDMGSFGCNLVNTASNHSFDFTQANITASVDAWKAVPKTLAVAGENRDQAEHDSVQYFTVKGVRFAFLAYTTYINIDAPAQNDYGVNLFSTDFASKQIAEAKQHGAKVIIASMRWGTEFSTAVNSQQQKDAQWLADQGVQLVLGHGSHELQPVQQLTGATGTKTVVWYSLGNFLNTQIPAETLFNGLAYMKINPKTYQVSVTGYLPIYVHYDWSAADAAAQNTNNRTNVHVYLLTKTTQAMLDSQQLKTTLDAQRQRFISTLSAYGANVPLLTPEQITR
ncbi:MAG: CapA family protein [Candidatus Saccharibacteria bacterium]|nr:CapA family protein [Candidatus Saccharibacteria bacterium]